jgi:lysophospholipase L1-like esterase
MTTHWVGSWATGPQLTEESNLPPTSLGNNTLRQIVYVTLGGAQIRVQLSNEFSSQPVTMNKVHVALATTGNGIDVATDRELTFSGQPSVTIPGNQAVYSDPLDFPLTALTKIAITIHFGTVPTDITGHPGSRTTSFIQSGDAVSSATLASPSMTDHWYFITRLDVMAPNTSGAVVVLGDSITDGRGSTTNGNDRWPDALARRMQANAATSGVSVLNQGIGGNAVLTGGLGPTAIARFERDVLGQSGVRWIIVLEGVNDIGGSSSANVATDLIAAYQGFIDAAHDRGLLIYGVPILPFGGSSYDSVAHEMARTTVNEWIRAPGNFDAVIDLDAAVRDPAAPTMLLEAYDTGDNLHLNPAGYQAMGDAVDLALFTTPTP